MQVIKEIHNDYVKVLRVSATGCQPQGSLLEQRNTSQTRQSRHCIALSGMVERLMTLKLIKLTGIGLQCYVTCVL